jgi:hypothetical protein
MSTNRHNGMGRRAFLKTSTCALATAAVGPRLFADVWQPKLMVAAFAPLDISAGTEMSAANVIDARRAPAPDAAFIRHGARISAFGLSGGEPRDRRAIDLLTHFAIGSGRERQLVPYFAWAGGGSNAPVSFHVPVDEEQRIRFSVTAKMPAPQAAGTSSRRGLLARRQTALEPRAIPVELSLGSEAGTIPLSRGFYVIVPVYDGQSAPRWSSYSLRQVAGGWALHELRGTEIRPATFEHFVVRVDYATKKDQKQA